MARWCHGGIPVRGLFVCKSFDFSVRRGFVGGSQQAQTYGYRFGPRLVGLSGVENAPRDSGLQQDQIIDRLLQAIGCTFAHRPDTRRHASMARDENDRSKWKSTLDLREKLQTIHSRQTKIDDYAIKHFCSAVFQKALRRGM